MSFLSPRGAADAHINDEVVSGTKNGVNDSFLTYYEYKPNTTQLFLNGIRQHAGIGYDYTEEGGKTIRILTPPLVTDTVIINYVRL